jgi:transcriptional regulator with XRE-family HTH domain
MADLPPAGEQPASPPAADPADAADPAGLADDVLGDPQLAVPTVPRMWVGAKLRRLRDEKGMTLEEAAAHIRGSAAKLSRLEQGRHRFKRRDVEDLLTLYDVTDPGERAMLIALTRRASARSWWHDFSDLIPHWQRPLLGQEQAACLIRTYEAQLVPVLLQTSDYARAVVQATHRYLSQDQLNRYVGLQMRRQDILRRADPPSLWTVIDEAALRRSIGGAEVMRAQIRHLIETAELRHIEVQVLPFSAGGHPALHGAITLVRMPEPALRDVVYLEHPDNARYLDKPRDVAHYRHILDRMTLAARPAKETAEELNRILGET